jgi:hypothetical protein
MGGQTEESVVHSFESQQDNKTTRQQVCDEEHHHCNHDHDFHAKSSELDSQCSEADVHHNHHHDHGGEADWIRIILIVLFVAILIINIVAEEHFLEEHMWQHVIKVHLPKIFLWTFGVILCLTILNNFVNIQNIIDSKPFIVLLIAILIGLIPQSGPHLIFLILFANGDLPLGIFLANCIVQDGHGALPLLAESRKAFLVSKAIKVGLAIVVGVIV